MCRSCGRSIISSIRSVEMKFFASKRYQRVTNFALAFMLVVSTLTASVPFLFAEKASAIGGSVCAGGCDSAQIDAALAATVAGDTINLDGDVTLTKEIKIDKQITLNGNGHSINATFANSSLNGGAAINLLNAPGAVISNVLIKNVGGTSLHGINAFKGTATLNAVSISNFAKYGLVVNGADVTVNNISTSGNAWGGVDVDQSSTSNPAKLTVNGVSSHTDVGNAAVFGTKHLFIDNVTKPVSIIDTNNQYAISNFLNARFYKLKVTPAAPTNLRFAEVVCGGATNVNSITPTWNAATNAASYNYKATTPSGAVYGPVSVGNVTSINGPFGGEGLSTFSVQSVSADGGVSAWVDSCGAIYDAQAPATPVAQTPHGWTNGANAFNWSSSVDAGSAVSYELQYSRTHPNNVAENGTFYSNTNSFETVLEDGPLFWHVRAVDAAGNVGAWSLPQSATIDATAPILTPNITGGILRGTQLITLNISEPYLKASAIRIVNPDYTSVAATPGIYNGLGLGNPLNYSWNTTLVDDGAYKIQYSARDILDHTTSDFYDVIVDNTVPTGAATLSDTEISSTDLSTTLTAQLTDATTNISNLKYRVFKVNADDSTTPVTAVIDGLLPVDGVYNSQAETVTTSINTATLTDGNYRVVLYIYDAAGNQGKKTVSFFVDKTVPAPVAGFPAGDLNATQVPAGFSWTQPTADAHGPLTYKVITAVSGHNSDDGVLRSGVQYVNTEGVTGTFLPYTSFTDGIFYWQVEATDALGNKALSNIHSVTIDTQIARPTLVSPTDGATVNGATLTQKWATNDNDINRYVYESYNSSTISEGNLRFRGEFTAKEKTATGVSNATFYWRVQAIDNFGNKSAWSELWKLTVDNTKPGVSINPIAVNPTSISGAVTETATVKVSIDGGTAVEVASNGTWTVPNTATEEGTHTVSVVATDLAGNTTETAVEATFVIDTVGPEVALTSPTVASTGNIVNFTIAGTTGDATVYDLYVNGEKVADQVATTGTASYTQPAAQGVDTTYTIRLVAFDQYGNDSEDTVELFVDNTSPALTVTPVTTQGNTPTITGTAELGATLVATFNGVTSEVVNNEGTYSYAVTNPLANGTYEFSITATDAAGNSTLATTSVIVAVAAPATEPTSTVLPPIVSQSGVLGANTDDDAAAAEVKGTSTDKTAAVADGVNNTDGKIFGLAWFWWLLIIAALAAIAWWIIGAIRRRNSSEA